MQFNKENLQKENLKEPDDKDCIHPCLVTTKMVTFPKER